jgi:glycosyltransferase involved in cell wall biosynthesis
MSTRPTISAVVIALDEERNLPGLLARLDWVDEVVVVDGGSRDATAAIARAWGARVAVRPFDDFAAQRNYALGLAGGEWVLSIDADERPLPGMPAEVRERTFEGQAAAFRVPIQSTIFGRRFRYSGTQDDRPVRVFHRDAASWEGDVHEVLRVKGKTGLLRQGLEHHTLPDVAAFLTKMERYTTLEAQARMAAGRPPRPRDRWIAPVREVFRRLVWKKGLLDGPEGWAFALLSGLSEWVLADKQQKLWSVSAWSGERGARSSELPLRLPRPAPHTALRAPRLHPPSSALRTPHSALSP